MASEVQPTLPLHIGLNPISIGFSGVQFHESVYKIAALESNPRHVHLEVTSILVNGAYNLVTVASIAVL